MRLARAILLAGSLALAAAALGCSGPEEKVRDHIEGGREALDEGRVDAALIEFKNALRIDPGNVEANVALAQIARQENNPHDAIFYYREAYRAAPENESAGVELALLLLSSDSDAARIVIDEVIAAHPNAHVPEMASSQIYLTQGEVPKGLRAARRAVELAPEVAGTHWQLGASCQAMIYRGNVLRKQVPDKFFEEGLEAYDGFSTAGGEEWKARLEQARILASWPGHGEEAIEAARRTVAVAGNGDPAIRHLVAKHLSRVAKARGDREALAEALEIFIDLNPRDLIAWKTLAELRRGAKGGPDRVYKVLIKNDPYDPEAHILYTAFIAQNLGVRAGLKYLERQIEAGVDPPRLLAEKANLQRSVRLKTEAKITRDRLKKEYQDSVWTILEECRQGFSDHRVGMVAVVLRNLARTDEVTDVFVLLAQVELSLRNVPAALAAAERAVEVAGRFNPKADRMLAITLVEAGRFAEAVEVLQHLDLRMGLLASEDMLLARAYYGTGDHLAGRQILLSLLDTQNLRYSRELVVLEYSRRERARPGQRDRIRAELDRALRLNPRSRPVLAQLVSLDLEMGRQAVALERIDHIKISTMTPELALLRARLRANLGNLQGAREDSRWVFGKDPSQPALLDLMVTVYIKLGVVEEENTALEGRIAELIAQKEQSRKGAAAKLAWSHVLHSRLLLALNREKDAVNVLAAAIFKNESVRDTKLDFAFLMAKKGEQLDFALRVARDAAESNPRDARAIDTVGFVLLKQGDYEAAHNEFAMATKLAKPPRALFYYHLHIALTHLGRPDAALRAIRSVVTIDPEFPDAVSIRDRLKARLEGAKTSG